MVVLNDFEAVKDGLSNDSLLGRPHSGIIKMFTKAPSMTDDSGQEWQDHRRLITQFLKDHTHVKGGLEERVIDETVFFIQKLDKRVGKETSMHKLLISSTTNIISYLVFGHRFELDDPALKSTLGEYFENAGKSISQTSLLVNMPFWLVKLIVTIGITFNKKAYQETMGVHE